MFSEAGMDTFSIIVYVFPSLESKISEMVQKWLRFNTDVRYNLWKELKSKDRSVAISKS